MSTTAYPTSYPIQELGTVMSKVTGGDVPAAQLVHACWVIVGYGLGTALPELTGSFSSVGSMDPATALKAAIDAYPEDACGGSAIVLPAIVWATVLKVAIKLILQFVV